MSFVKPEILRDLPYMSRAQLDALDFGAVRVDDSGNIQQYNKHQAELANVDQEAAIGRNFFRELAPCTNNRLVFGRFKDGVAANKLDAVVTYAFTYKMRPTLVNIHLYRDPVSKTNWVMVRRAGARK
ncbi:MAG: PAS domain-containing protein [Armatimonadaceae bacterium]